MLRDEQEAESINMDGAPDEPPPSPPPPPWFLSSDHATRMMSLLLLGQVLRRHHSELDLFKTPTLHSAALNTICSRSARSITADRERGGERAPPSQLWPNKRQTRGGGARLERRAAHQKSHLLLQGGEDYGMASRGGVKHSIL